MGVEALLGGPHDVTHPGVVGDIERERERGIGVRASEILDPGRVASRHNNPLATVHIMTSGGTSPQVANRQVPAWASGSIQTRP